MTGRDVYIAVYQHRHDPPGDRPVGSVWRCECGQYLFVVETDGCAPPTARWLPVRWWNFRIRRLITQTDGQFRHLPENERRHP